MSNPSVARDQRTYWQLGRSYDQEVLAVVLAVDEAEARDSVGQMGARPKLLGSWLGLVQGR